MTIFQAILYVNKHGDIACYLVCIR